MRITTCSLVVAFFAVSASAQLGPSQIAAMETAYYARDVDAGRELLEEMEDAEPTVRAWAIWRVANMYPIRGVEGRVKRDHERIRKPLLERAENLLEEHLEGSPEDVHALTLLSGVFQSRITSAFSGMRFGRRSNGLLARALEQAPDDPRALYLSGMSQLMAPGPWGDRDEGRRRLERAVELFEAEMKESGSDPAWGFPEALAFLGLAFHGEGDLAGARSAWKRALAIEPNFEWVRLVLLPQVG